MQANSRSGQLRLVTDPPPAFGAVNDTRRVFEHWVLVNGRSPARCKLGPTRRKAIDAMLTLYDADTLMLACEGLASDELEGCTDRMREAMRELEWLLATEARIERFAQAAQKRIDQMVRDEAAAHARRQQREQQPEPLDAEREAAYERARERLREAAAQMRRGSA